MHPEKIPVPVPSIIINGELAFKTIPGKEELVEFLKPIIHKQKRVRIYAQN